MYIKRRKNFSNYHMSYVPLQLDLLSMLPLDLFYLIPGFEYNAVARVLRMLRVRKQRGNCYNYVHDF